MGEDSVKLKYPDKSYYESYYPSGVLKHEGMILWAESWMEDFFEYGTWKYYNEKGELIKTEEKPYKIISPEDSTNQDWVDLPMIISPSSIVSGTFSDPRDGKTYKFVKIGEQTWMAENLNYAAENSLCYYNKPENCQKCGRLYDWETAKKSCPKGWRLPTSREWSDLGDAIGGPLGAGKYLKTTSGWDKGNGTDEYGFSILACGGYNAEDSSSDYGSHAYFWTTEEKDTSQAWTKTFCHYVHMLSSTMNKAYKFSIRCLKL